MMSHLRKRLFTFAFLAICFLSLAFPCSGKDFSRAYPHWNKSDQLKLVWFDRQLEKLPSQGSIAIFDFDGTMISEEYPTPDGRKRSGQSAWHQWGSQHLSEFPFLFPKFRIGKDVADDARHVQFMDNVYENMTPVEVPGWMKFHGISTFEEGMTPEEMQQALSGFLDENPPASYAFFPVLDVMQHLIDRGFHVWIISGSNPWYIAGVLQRISETCEYQPGRKYDFRGLLSKPFSVISKANPQGSRIIGNMAKQNTVGRFTALYDDSFVTDWATQPMIIEKMGKVAALKGFIEDLEAGEPVFCAGNSDGDYEVLSHIIGLQSRNLGFLVNPRGKLFPKLQGRQTMVIPAHPQP